MDKTIISTSDAPRAIGPYSQAVKAGNLLFVSGCLGLAPATSRMVDGGVTAQAARALDNLAAILAAAGARTANVVKTTIFLASMADFAEVNRIYGERFPEAPPARSTVEVAGLPLGALVEIEAVALLA
ncbi:MAG: Rid family detoxifying hydrolase [Deltaproteobacteria bacterium]|nr:Rid family detoxifying hydrolase [Deltaproteobacteria bacterium]